MDEAGQSSPCLSTEISNKCISSHIRYDFQVHSLCAKAHENGHIRFDEGWLSCMALLQGEGASIVDPSHVEWRAGRHTGGWELSHLLVLCPCSDTSANSAAPADVASQSSSPEHMNSCTYMEQGPQWQRERCTDKKRSLFRWSDPWRMGGCFWELDR